MIEQEKEPPMQTATFVFQPRPRFAETLQRVTGERSRVPTYLHKSCIESVLELIYPSYRKEELEVDPPLDAMSPYIEQLKIRYNGPEDRIRQIQVTLDKETIDVQRQYKIEVTGTHTALEEAVSTISAAVADRKLRINGKLSVHNPSDSYKSRSIILDYEMDHLKPALG